MPFECDILLDDIEQTCDLADDELRRLPAYAVRLAGVEGLTEAKATRRYQDRTGRLTGRAVVRMVSITGDEAACEISWPVPYASFVDEGTKPHVITARNGGVLAFPGRGGGTIFRRSVNHPGTKPTHFVQLAQYKVELVLQRETDATVRKIAAIFFG